MATMVPPTKESRLRENRGQEALDQGVNMVLLVSALFSLYFYQVAVDRHPDSIPLLFSRAWWLRKDFSRRMKEKLWEEKELRQKAEDEVETRGVELEGARAELKTAQAELAELKESSSKYREDAVMEISQLHAWVDDAERRLAEVPREIAAAKTATLAEYQSSTEFRQVQDEGFEDGVCTFIYNVWCECLEWDLSFLGEAAREMVAEFNAPPETHLEEPPTEFVPAASQSPQVADRPPQVINKDSTTVSAGGDGEADEDDEVMEVDNPAGVLSSD